MRRWGWIDEAVYCLWQGFPISDHGDPSLFNEVREVWETLYPDCAPRWLRHCEVSEMSTESAQKQTTRTENRTGIVRDYSPNFTADEVYSGWCQYERMGSRDTTKIPFANPADLGRTIEYAERLASRVLKDEPDVIFAQWWHYETFLRAFGSPDWETWYEATPLRKPWPIGQTILDERVKFCDELRWIPIREAVDDFNARVAKPARVSHSAAEKAARQGRLTACRPKGERWHTTRENVEAWQAAEAHGGKREGAGRKSDAAKERE